MGLLHALRRDIARFIMRRYLYARKQRRGKDNSGPCNYPARPKPPPLWRCAGFSILRSKTETRRQAKSRRDEISCAASFAFVGRVCRHSCQIIKKQRRSSPRVFHAAFRLVRRTKNAPRQAPRFTYLYRIDCHASTKASYIRTATARH